MSNKNYVTYEEFGAVGDGVTDDFAAIYKAHEYANENGLSVKASDEAHYYIHDPRIDGEVQSVIIKTDVNWGNAQFTIDDRDVSVYKDALTYSWYAKPIFKVLSDYPVEQITDADMLARVLENGLNRETKKIPLSFDYPVMIIPYNSSHKVYRRCGYGAFNGKDMHECIVLDTEGNVSEETPIIFNYESLSYINVYRIDVKPITIEGGTFTTRNTRVNILYTNENGNKALMGGYLDRGLYVNRSNTIVKNVKHYITDEPTMNDQVKNGEIDFVAACYHGFFHASASNHVTFDGCVLTGRRCYKRPTGGTGGTYDLSGNSVNGIYFKNCTQSNFWITVDENNIIHPAKEGDPGAVTSMSYYHIDGNVLKMHWGIGGTNFCKNMEYHNSTLSRFDAHEGLCNGKIINSTVNYMAITGVGKFEVENTRWFSEGSGFGSNSLIHLRADYGSTWEGDVSIKNVEAYIYTEKNAYLVYHSYNNWYYGYKACFPNITIENLTYFDQKTFKKLPEGYEIFYTGESLVKEPALHLPETVNLPPRFPDVDLDGDGFVDGTNIPYDGVVDRKGVVDETQKRNLNAITPPERLKLVNNEGGYKIIVLDTSLYEGLNGGFFANTSFEIEDKKLIGTAHTTDTGCFEFAPEEKIKIPEV